MFEQIRRFTPFQLLLLLALCSLGSVHGTAARSQDALCFVDDDGVTWDLRLAADGTVLGTAQVPLAGCEPGRVAGNYVFADAVVPLHLFVPLRVEACLPRATFSGQFFLQSGGTAEIFTFGQLAEVSLTPCVEREGLTEESWTKAPWWVPLPTR